jgi:sulfite reductase alpha subunit-like flavoprotein
MDRAVILVGTETGNAEDVAEEIRETFEDLGIEAEVVDMEDADLGLFDGNRAVLVCTSTSGDGELPDNSFELHEMLEDEQPDLTGLPFAVCALGDSVYPDFCEAGKTWSRTLSALGARELLERHEIDGGPSDEDLEAVRAWTSEAARRLAGGALEESSAA